MNEYPEFAKNWNFFAHGALPLCLKSQPVGSRRYLFFFTFFSTLLFIYTSTTKVAALYVYEGGQDDDSATRVPAACDIHHKMYEDANQANTRIPIPSFAREHATRARNDE